MGLFEHFPYVNFHNLNLDWILKKIKELLTRMAAAEEKLEEHEQRLDAAEDMLEDHETRLDAAEAAIDSLDNRLDTVESDVSGLKTRMTAAEGNISNLQTRMTAAESAITLVTPENVTAAFLSGCTSNNADFYTSGSEIYRVGNRIYGALSFGFQQDGVATMIDMPAAYKPFVGSVANFSAESTSPTGTAMAATYIAGSNITPSSGFYIQSTYANVDERFTLILDYMMQAVN